MFPVDRDEAWDVAFPDLLRDSHAPEEIQGAVRGGR